MYEGFNKKTAAPQVLKFLPNLKTVDGEMCAGMDSGDEVAAAVKGLLSDKFGSVEDALGQVAGHGKGDMLSKGDFIAAMGGLGVEGGDAEHIFENCSAGGQASMDMMCEWVNEN